MDETRSTEAIFLSRFDYKDSDSLVNVYTPHEGRLTLLARGTKKPGSKLAGHIEPLTFADVMIIKGKGFDYLGSAITRQAYPGLRSDLNKLYYAGRVAALYLRQTEENVGDERMFALLLEFLEVVNSLEVEEEFNKEKGSIIFAALLLKFLEENGHRPELFSCLACRQAVTPGDNIFDLLSGGIVCPDCRLTRQQIGESRLSDLVFISDDCIKLSRLLMSQNLEFSLKIKAQKRVIDEVVKLWSSFLNFAMSG